MNRILWLTGALAAFGLLPPSGPAGPRPPPPRAERTQFVLLSIDSTPSPQRPLDRTGFYALFQAMNRRRDPNGPVNAYTLFIATGGLQLAPWRDDLSEEERPFQGVLPVNRPVIHYADDLERIRNKTANIRELAAAGVEIGSHAVRHDHGGEWSLERWRFEFRDHQRVLDLLHLPRPLGFRAPFLDENEHMYRVEQEHGMIYDSSQSGGSAWPSRYPGTSIWVFGVPSVTLPSGRRALYFDLNMDRLLREDARAAGVRGEARLAQWMENAYSEAGYRAFLSRYNGNRAPFLVSGHGGFRLGCIQLMRRVCHLPHVRCAPFREAARYMNAHPEMEGLRD